ncbi:MAG TPA: hypothetical protein VG649_18630 [Candidatus Angelobacter sp.]|jgi:hypothetical protein|nr:hypothetical protein [Candidatus Angelobacter sp.]
MSGRLGLVDARQFEASLSRRWIGAFCLLLVLFFSGLVATHAHSAAHTGSDSLCLICISVGAQSPAIVIDALPALLTIALVALPSEVRGNSLANRMELFIRPPPSSL